MVLYNSPLSVHIACEAIRSLYLAVIAVVPRALRDVAVCIRNACADREKHRVQKLKA